jgi:hypothetical protein
MQLDTTISSSKLGLYVLPNHEPCYLVAIQIKLQYIEISLLDMRALACFIDKNFAKQLNPKLMKKPFPTPIEVIDRWFLASKNIIEETQLGWLHTTVHGFCTSQCTVSVHILTSIIIF